MFRVKTNMNNMKFYNLFSNIKNIIYYFVFVCGIFIFFSPLVEISRNKIIKFIDGNERRLCQKFYEKQDIEMKQQRIGAQADPVL